MSISSRESLRAWRTTRPGIRSTAWPVALGVLATVAAAKSWALRPPGPPAAIGSLLLAVVCIATAELSARPPVDPADARAIREELRVVWLVPTALLYGPAAVATTVMTTHLWDWLRYRPHKTKDDVADLASAVLAYTTGATVVDQFLGWRHTPDRLPISWTAAATITLAAAVVLTLRSVLATATRLLSDDDEPSDARTVHRVVAAGLGICVATLVGVNPALVAAVVPLAPLLRQAHLATHYQAAARTDPKTGLANMAAWHEDATRDLHRARRNREPVSLLMVDLDHFKQINDTRGHVAGDHALRTVAATLADHGRPYDLLGRFGGEEFVILLPATDTAQALAVAERQRAAIAALRIPTPFAQDAAYFTLTASFGVSTLLPDAPGHTLDTAIEQADRALRAAKRHGRNQVNVYTPTTDELPMEAEGRDPCGDPLIANRAPLPRLAAG